VNKHVADAETLKLRALDAARKSSSRRSSRRLAPALRKHLWLITSVVIPTLVAVVYYALIAAPIYVSSAQFIVKNSTQSSSLSGMGQFLQSVGVTVSASDAYSVDAYITSRDALAELEKRSDIRALYNRREADLVARFPNFLELYRPAFEYLYWHYQNWIEVDFDSTTNITTVYAYAFRAEDARAVAAQLLVLSELAVNRLNDRVKADALRAMKDEVAHLQQRAEAVQAQITDFRNSQLILDPNQSSTAATTLRSTLESALVSARALLGQLQDSAPNSPQIAAMRARIKSLEDQVAEQEHKDAGGVNTLAPKVSQYDALLLQQQFAQQMLQAAVSSLETAEVNVQEQMLYVARIAEPNVPDWPQYPYRVVDILLVFVTALLIYGVGRILGSVVREHMLA
jgi:capsular polysaccharide transport system permease protein